MGGSGAGDATSVIKGGGTDLTRTAGQQKKGESEVEKKAPNLKAAEAERALQEKNRLLELKAKLDAAIDANEALQPFKKQLRVDLTPDGLRIQIVDEQNRPMFDSGSAALQGLHQGDPARARPADERRAEPDLAVRAHRRQAVLVGRARLQQLGAVGRSRQRVAPRAHRRRHQREQDDPGDRAGRRGAAREGRRLRPGQPPDQHHRPQRRGRAQDPRGRRESGRGARARPAAPAGRRGRRRRNARGADARGAPGSGTRRGTGPDIDAGDSGFARNIHGAGGNGGDGRARRRRRRAAAATTPAAAR